MSDNVGMRALLAIAVATLVMFLACNRYAAYADEALRWSARDYRSVVATVENGGLRAIEVADSVMVSLGYDPSKSTTVLSMDSTIFCVDYVRKDAYTDYGDSVVIRLGGNGIVAYISRADLTVLQFYRIP
jgi:hypothetical protein